MVSLECRECGREEHFQSIEDATLVGWEYNYDWIAYEFFSKMSKLWRELGER